MYINRKNSADDSCVVHFRIAVINQNNIARSIYNKIERKIFSPEFNGWGILTLVSNDQLLDGYLVNDSVTFEVTISVVESLSPRQIKFFCPEQIQGRLQLIAQPKENLAKWRWEIPSWSQRGYTICSPPMMLGEYPWLLEIRPNPDRNNRVQATITIDKEITAKVRAVYRLDLIHRGDNSKSISLGMHSVAFDFENKLWGFSKTISQTNLIQLLQDDHLLAEITLFYFGSYDTPTKQFFEPMDVHDQISCIHDDGFEIVDWKIPYWSTRRDMMESPAIDVNGDEFRLLIYPNGEASPEYTSIFIRKVKNTDMDIMLSVKAKGLVKESAVLSSSVNMGSTVMVWGWKEFIQKKFVHLYVTDDVLHIQCVIAAKKPTENGLTLSQLTSIPMKMDLVGFPEEVQFQRFAKYNDNVYTILTKFIQLQYGIVQFKMPEAEDVIYFEVDLLECEAKYLFGVGFAPERYEYMTGWYHASIGLHADDGRVYDCIDNKGIDGTTYECGDTIGVLYDRRDTQIYYFKNGKKVTENKFYRPKQIRLLPTVTGDDCSFAMRLKPPYKYSYELPEVHNPTLLEEKYISDKLTLEIVTQENENITGTLLFPKDEDNEEKTSQFHGTFKDGTIHIISDEKVGLIGHLTSDGLHGIWHTVVGRYGTFSLQNK